MLFLLQALRELDAAQQADEEAAQDGADGSKAAFMHGALLRRLADDEPSVLAAALSLPSLRHLPSSALYTALAEVLARARTAAGAQSGSSTRKAWRSVVQKVRHSI